MRRSIRYWWSFLVSGILLFIAGCVVLTYPVSSYISISLITGILVLFLGVSHISFASMNKRGLPGWGWHLSMGILDVALGIILLLYPRITMAVLPTLVGMLFFIRGITLMSYAFALKRFAIPGWGWLVAGAVLTLLFGLFIIYYPLLGFFTIIIWTAAAFMIAAVFNVLLALRLKRDKDVPGVIL